MATALSPWHGGGVPGLDGVGLKRMCSKEALMLLDFPGGLAELLDQAAIMELDCHISP